MSDSKPVLGVIGGSGVYEIDGLQNKRWKKVSSSFGEPSDELLFGDFTYMPGTSVRQLHGLDASPKRDQKQNEDDVQFVVAKGASLPFLEKEVYEGPLLNSIPLRK